MKDALLIVRRNFYQSFEDIGGLLKRHFMLLIVMSIVYYVVVLLLRSVSGSNVESATKYSSLGLYLFSRKSSNDLYQLVDQSRDCFLFMAVLLGVVYRRARLGEGSFGKVAGQITGNEVVFLLGSIALAAIFDPLLFHWYEVAIDWKMHSWSRSLIFHARIYLPLFLLLVTLQNRVYNDDDDQFFGKQFLAMLLCMWLMNEFLYEVFLLADGLILSVFYDLVDDKVLLTFLLSVIMAPLMAFVLAGYATLFSFDFALPEKANEEKIGHGLVEPSILDAGDREASI